MAHLGRQEHELSPVLMETQTWERWKKAAEKERFLECKHRPMKCKQAQAVNPCLYSTLHPCVWLVKVEGHFQLAVGESGERTSVGLATTQEMVDTHVMRSSVVDKGTKDTEIQQPILHVEYVMFVWELPADRGIGGLMGVCS